MNGADPSATDAQAAAAPGDLRPGKLLIALSAVVIGGCLFMVGGAIGAIASTFDPCSAISGAIMLPVPLFIAIQQYRGVFHRQAGAAFAAACCLVGFGALFVTGSILNMLEFAFETRRAGLEWSEDWPLFLVLGCLGLVGLIDVAFGWRTIQWSRSLRAAGPQVVSKTFSLRELMAMIAMIALVAGVARLTVDRRPSTGVNVSPDQAPTRLPPTAQDVCYQVWGRGGYLVEFTTDEPTFRQWIAEVVAPAARDGVKVTPLEKRSECVIRDYRGKSWIATDVLHYSWVREGASSSEAIFDPATGRAYCMHSPI